MKYVLTLCILFLVGPRAFAQEQFGRRDSLRGGERIERSCFDIRYYDLSVNLDIPARKISGTNKILFEVVSTTNRIQLDLFENMTIEAITLEGRSQKYTRDFDAVFVDFDKTINKGERVEVIVTYSGNPRVAKMAPWDGGFSWSTDKDGNPWVAVSCQGIGASLWWPTKEVYSDEPDSMRIHCRVPSSLYAVCNGQEEKAIQHSDSTTTYNWKVSYPINNYNVTLNIAKYVHFDDTYISPDGDRLALDYYVLPASLELAKKQFQQVKPMLACYEKFLGKYPFWNDGYALVETPYLGMEHQGAIAYGNKFKRGYMGMDRSGQNLDFDYIIIHETGHEWWGNSVSAQDLADMWIHESFCTYTEAIYVECMYDYTTAMKYVNALKSSVSNSSPMIGIYGLNNEGNGDMYLKGMLFLNTLRHLVDDDEKWWAMIKNMSDTKFKIRTTNYDEVVAYFSEQSGMNLSKIFEQYVTKKSPPVLEYDIQKKNGKTILKYRWKTDVADFVMPVILTVEGKDTRLSRDAGTKTLVWEGNRKLEFDTTRFYYELREVDFSKKK